MRSILEELWYSNVWPNHSAHGLNDETKKLMKYVADHHDRLYSTLTEQQKELFEKFNDCHSELASIDEREIFIYGFRLGARIAIEVMGLEIN